jgi:hypothetical protein
MGGDVWYDEELHDRVRAAIELYAISAFVVHYVDFGDEEVIIVSATAASS